MSENEDITDILTKLSDKTKKIQTENNILKSKLDSATNKLDKIHLVLNGGSLPAQKVQLARNMIDELRKELKKDE